jgi:hypothetical protein
MWSTFKKWWKGYTHLRVYLSGGQIIDLFVTDWKVEHDGEGQVLKYNFVFHARNRNYLQTLAIKDISAIVLIKA